MRKTKSEGKTVGIFANCSQCVANFAMRNFAMRKTTANFAMRKTIWQCENPFGNAKNHLAMRKTIWQCENPFGNAKIHLRISQCEISQCENHIANFAMRKENFAMPNGCQPFAKIHVFLFSLLIFNICSKICTKLLKLKQ